MGLDSMRGSYYGRCPPILVGALFLICVVLMFNWWSSSAQNYDLIKQLDDISEQLKISSDELDRCNHQRSIFENQIKASEEESAQLRVKLEQFRTDTSSLKKQLNAKDDEIKSAMKAKGECEASLTRCDSELKSLKSLDISKSSTIATLRYEKEQLKEEIQRNKNEVKSLQEELRKVNIAHAESNLDENTAVSVKPPRTDKLSNNVKTENLALPFTIKPVITHTDVENPDRDENNAAERDDGANTNNIDEETAADKDAEGNEDARDDHEDEYPQISPDDEGEKKKPGPYSDLKITVSAN